MLFLTPNQQCQIMKAKCTNGKSPVNMKILLKTCHILNTLLYYTEIKCLTSFCMTVNPIWWTCSGRKQTQCNMTTIRSETTQFSEVNIADLHWWQSPVFAEAAACLVLLRANEEREDAPPAGLWPGTTKHEHRQQYNDKHNYTRAQTMGVWPGTTTQEHRRRVCGAVQLHTNIDNNTMISTIRHTSMHCNQRPQNSMASDW